MKNFESRLKGGHPNSLGNTIEIVEEVLSNPHLFDELFNCYFSDDEVVRLRVSNAMKRICNENKALIIPYIDKFQSQIAAINQASTQWTLSQLFGMLVEDMTAIQIKKAKEIMIHNLVHHTDWIVLNQTMLVLADWAKSDVELKQQLWQPIKKLAYDPRKSVSKTAQKALNQIST